MAKHNPSQQRRARIPSFASIRVTRTLKLVSANINPACSKCFPHLFLRITETVITFVASERGGQSSIWRSMEGKWSEQPTSKKTLVAAARLFVQNDTVDSVSPSL
jgi:hypothetical protein